MINVVVRREWIDPDNNKYCEEYRIYYKSGKARTIKDGFTTLPVTVVDFILNADFETRHDWMQKKVSGRLFDCKTTYYS